MRKRGLAVILAALLLCASCGAQNAAEAEIKIPILGENDTPEYDTVAVTVGNLEQTTTVAGKIGYIYADSLFTDFESNLLEYCAERGQKLSEGDPIAIFDSSSLDYAYTSQRILTDDAYASYQASGSEATRLEYEIQAKQLEYLEYQKDQFTIRAPYDCVVTATERSLEVGTVVPEGTLVCTVAKENDVYVYTSENKDFFRTGMPVSVKFGASAEYPCHVVMTPEGKGGGALNSAVILKPDEGMLERILAEVDNVLTAGWATLIVPTVQKYDVLLLPEEAVKNFSGSTYCSLLDHGQRVRVPVEVGGVFNGTAVILSGVSAGDEIAY